MPCRVLIVDSDAHTRAHLGGVLERHGYQTLSAEGVSTAAQILESRRPDLLVTEIRLDGYNGLHLVATAPSPVRAIVLTAYADATIERDARRLGADYLTKPVDEEALLAAIARQLSRGRSEDLFVPARQYPRTRLHDVVMMDFEGTPVRLFDVSDGGACLELPELPASLSSGPGTLRSEDVAVTMYVAWERQIEPGRCICGVQVTQDAAERWRAFVASTLAGRVGHRSH